MKARLFFSATLLAFAMTSCSDNAATTEPTSHDVNTRESSSSNFDLVDCDLQDAVLEDRIDDLRRLLSDCRLDATDPEVGEALGLAARAASSRSVDELINFGVDPNVLDEQGYSPLLFALTPVQEGRLDRLADRRRIMTRLLRAGADIDYQEGGNGPVVYTAAVVGEPSIVKLLLKSGADVNAVNGEGNTPLMGAVYSNSVQTARLLVQAGANLACTNKDGLDVSALVDAVGTKEMRALTGMAADQGAPKPCSTTIG